MKKRIIAAILLSAMLFSFAVSCGKSDKGNPASVTTAANADATATSADGTTAEVELQPELPEYDCGGATFTFLVRGPTFNEWESQDIGAEEENGEPVNDSVFSRNLYINEKYNVEIAAAGVGDPGASAKKAVQAGDQSYDIFMANTSESATLATQGFVYNLYDIPYLNLEAPWWDQQSVKDLSMANLLYFCTGDISIMCNDATWILMFNKQIAEDFKISGIYDQVKEGVWTFDQMIEYMELVSADLNGDGVISPKDDRLGFATHASSIEGLFFGADLKTTSKDDKDIPYIDMDTDKIVNVIEKANVIMCDTNIAFNLSSNKFSMSNCLTDLQPVFENGHSLFYGEVMQCIIRLRAMETNFGVIPFPKADETQERYSHFVHTTGCMVSVPLSSADTERAGIILEAMAAKSRYTLRRAYYDICLEGKFMRDVESEDMLDIILASRSWDLGYIYGWGGLFSAFSNCVSKNNTDFASKFASAETKAQTALDKTLSAWEENA
ncbi:MAG TPA: extracellular solute-binding protein [Clostridiales bacterium]|jgi:hypothetical protein|nr:extracellular solute-binding protein [Clostridiales bacterium]